MITKTLTESLLERDFGFSLEGIETDINLRWENGIEHHPESEKLMKAIAALDYAFADDYFSWNIGGDGDNGEFMMYLLDIYFEARDKDKCVNGLTSLK